MIVIKDYDCISVGKRRRPGGLCELSLDSTDAVIFVLRMPKKGEYKYSDEDLAEVASNYDYMPDFRKKEPKIYDAIVSRKKLDEFCGHMRLGRPKTWTVEELKAIADQYHDLSLFRKEQPKAYDAIVSRKKVEELCGHMKRGQRKEYTYEELKAIANQYHEMSAFMAEQFKVYHAIQGRGLLEELCGHMGKKRRDSYTDKELTTVAKDYKDLTKFKREQPNIYGAIQRRGLINKLCGHMKRHVRPDYTDEELAEIASRYTDVTQFKREQRQPYFAIHRRGKFDEMCGHMKRNMRKAYTKEEIRAIALNYSTKSEFQEKDGAAYQAASHRGIIDEVCGHMKELRRPKGFYNKGYCHVVALDYKTIGEFRQGNSYAYTLAHKKGWLDDICSHMEIVNNWNQRLVYVYTFPDGYAYVGLTDDVRRRKNEHLHKYTHKKLSPVLRHYRETGLNYEYKELTDWLDAATAAKVEDEYIKKYKADGWKMLNRMRGGGLGGNIKKVHKAKAVSTIVGRYEYVEDFRDNEPEIYEDLCDGHQFSKFCAGLKCRKKPSGYWTLERAVAVIPECETAAIFRKRYRQAYRVVKAAGLIAEHYPEKPKPKCKWTLENCAYAARCCETKTGFRKKYPRAYKRLLEEGLLDELFEDKEK